jgi:endonuclease YncB( thermonuclease family)
MRSESDLARRGAYRKVASVFDSDTFEVLRNNRAERIRLSGIDCPEKVVSITHQNSQPSIHTMFPGTFLSLCAR